MSSPYAQGRAISKSDSSKYEDLVAGVAQGLERLTVAQEAVGSILIIRPILS